MKLSDGTVISSAFRPDPSHTQQGFSNIKKTDQLKIGTIIAVRYIDSTDGVQKSANNDSEGVDGSPYETVYDVRVDDHNVRPFIFNGCRALKPFMGANNYFEVIHESADNSPTYIEQGPPGSPVGGIFAASAESLVGSRCVILCIEGASTAPVIVGFLQHPARKSKVTKDKGLHMEFEFNGVMVSIDKDGALSLIGNTPWMPVIAPITGPIPDSPLRADPLAGPLTIMITKDMQFSVEDNIGQRIAIDRVAKTMEFTNGSELLRFTKSLTPSSGLGELTVDGKLTVSTLDTEWSSTKSFKLTSPQIEVTGDTKFSATFGQASIKTNMSFNIEAQEMSIKAQTKFSVDAGKVAIKGATGELLTIIAALIDAIGKLAANSPVGPCAPLTAAPTWTAVMAELTKLKGMTA